MEIIGNEVVIPMVLNGPNESAESTGVAECALLDLLKDLREVWIKIVRAIVVSVAEILNILCQVAEQEDVVLTNLTRDFNLI